MLTESARPAMTISTQMKKALNASRISASSTLQVSASLALSTRDQPQTSENASQMCVTFRGNT